MAQTYPNGLLNTSDAARIPERLARTMADLVPGATTFKSIISPSMQNLDTDNGCAMSYKYEYSERAYTPARVKLNGALTSVATSVTFDKPLAKVNDLVVVDQETLKLTANPTGDLLTFTCSRSYRTPAAAAHVDGSTCLICNAEYEQGSASLVPSTVVEPNMVTAYSRIFKEAVGISRTMKNIEKHGLRSGNWYEDSKMDKALEMMHQLEHESIFAKAVTPVSTTTGGNFDGFWERVSASSATNMSSVDLTMDSLEAAVLACADYTEDLGEMDGPGYLFLGRFQKGRVDRWALPYYRQNDVLTGAFGTVVNYIQIGGKAINVLACSKLTSQGLLVTAPFCGLGPLTPDDELAFYPDGRDGDREKGELVMEMVGEFKEPLAHHCFYGMPIS
jgi:hypothetical protein